MNLNEQQKDTLGIIITVALFWFGMSFFIVTQPNYIKAKKVAPIEIKHEQSKVLDAYGELFMKKRAR